MPCFEYRCAEEACPERATEWRSKWTPDAPACPQGHGDMARNWQAEARVSDAANGYPFITSNITGKPVEVTDAAHHRALCAAHGKIHRDDAAFIDEGNFYEPKLVKGRDGKWRTEIVYQNGSGRGNKGQWV